MKIIKNKTIKKMLFSIYIFMIYNNYIKITFYDKEMPLFNGNIHNIKSLHNLKVFRKYLKKVYNIHRIECYFDIKIISFIPINYKDLLNLLLLNTYAIIEIIEINPKVVTNTNEIIRVRK